MSKLFYTYWGKTPKNKKASMAPYHLLSYHCLDVAAVGWAFLEQEAPLRQKFSQGLGLSEKDFQKLFCFFLCLHDLGKFSAAFQNLNSEVFNQLSSHSLYRHYNDRHDSLGYWALLELFKKHPVFEFSSQDSREQRIFRRYLDLWFQLVTGHHGKPPLNPKKEGELKIELSFVKSDGEAVESFVKELAEYFNIDLSQMFASALTKESLAALKKYSWTLAGLTVLCDWVGSNTEFFPYLAEPDFPLGEYFEQRAQPQAKQAIETLGLLSAPIATYAGLQNLFPKITHPTPLQKFCHEVPLSGSPQLWIIEDVTGSGKTEAAMILSHRLMAQGLAQGCFIGLPTMATADGMYERMVQAYAKLYQETSHPSLILSHSARHLSKTFRTSVMESDKVSVLDQNYQKEEESASAQCSRWLADSTKKSLLADMGVGTLDQALLSVLPARHQSLRFFGLSNKVLIVDEVHAYDPYMSELLKFLLEGHASSGGNAILLSATLPQKLRESFVLAWQKGVSTDSEVRNISLKQEAYPLVTLVSSQGLDEFPVEAWPPVQRQVSCRLLHQEDEPLNLIRKSVQEGKCICWIRNTIKDAHEAYEKLKSMDWMQSENLTLFHSRFALKDRLDKQEQVLNAFGKESCQQTRAGQVLIATQIVEQSLDLDFDVMVSDLAPMDLLIQRMGRLQRHRRDAGGRLTQENEVREKPVFYVYGPEFTSEPKASWYAEKFKSGAYVYPDVGQLWLTQGLLVDHPKINIPQDCRALIEGVYGGRAVELPESLQQGSDKAWSKRSSEKEIARLNKLKFSDGYSFASQSAWDEEAKTPTRLAEDQRRCYLAIEKDGCLQPLYSGDFAWDLSSVRVPAYQLSEVEMTESQQQQVKVLQEAYPYLDKSDLVVPLSATSPGNYFAQGRNEKGESLELRYAAQEYGLHIIEQ